MEPRKLEHFIAVAEAGHFTRAADELHISQSGLSASVRSFEHDLGLQLFERSTRRVVLTAAGAALLPRARRILREIADARSAVGALREANAGTLALGVVQTLTAVDLPAVIAAFHTRHPGVIVTLREDPTTPLLAALAAGDLDLAFVALDADPLPPGTAVVRYYPETLTLICAPGHHFAAAGPLPLRALRGERFVDFQAGPGLQTVVESVFREAGVRREITFRTSEMDQLLALVGHGLGVAVVPEPIARGSGLHRVPLLPEPPARRLALVGRGDGAADASAPTNPAARVFLAGLPD